MIPIPSFILWSCVDLSRFFVNKSFLRFIIVSATMSHYKHLRRSMDNIIPCINHIEKGRFIWTNIKETAAAECLKRQKKQKSLNHFHSICDKLSN